MRWGGQTPHQAETTWGGRRAGAVRRLASRRERHAATRAVVRDDCMDDDRARRMGTGLRYPARVAARGERHAATRAVVRDGCMDDDRARRMGIGLRYASLLPIPVGNRGAPA